MPTQTDREEQRGYCTVGVCFFVIGSHSCRFASSLCLFALLLAAQSVFGTELVLTPDCPAPGQTVNLQAFPTGQTRFAREPIQVTQSGYDLAVFVAATQTSLFPNPTPSAMATTIGPFPVGHYRLSLYQRLVQSDGSLGPAILDGTRDFAVQTEPPPCTPASIAVTPSFAVVALGAPFAPATAQVLDTVGRPVPGVTLRWMRIIAPGDSFGGANPDVNFDGVEALTDSAGRATISGTANNVRGPATYLVYHKRGDIVFKAFFVLANGQVDGEASPVIEYTTAADPDHFFLTADAHEMLAVDRGTAGEWNRTGAVFLAWPALSANAGLANVCRFYGSVAPGPNSHFYTSDPGECAFLVAQAAQTPPDQARWNYEGRAFGAMQPENGVCPGAAPTPVYRLYNDGYSRGLAPHHRLTNVLSVYSQMQVLGWKGEGITMCLR